MGGCKRKQAGFVVFRLPETAVLHTAAKADGFENMAALYLIGCRQIGYRAGDAQNPVETAGRKREFLHHIAQRFFCLIADLRLLVQIGRRQRNIEFALAAVLALAGSHYPFQHCSTAFTSLRLQQIGTA